ncbi:short chain dehydrogenase/reductase domain protein [Mycobacterium xenopi 3993]|nr:short chain dehydrogenase/reductase domain protein [Mycobacterium xenopi 3993]
MIHGIKAFVPIMLEQGEGHVVNTCSGNGGFAPIARAPWADRPMRFTR